VRLTPQPHHDGAPLGVHAQELPRYDPPAPRLAKRLLVHFVEAVFIFVVRQHDDAPAVGSRHDVVLVVGLDAAFYVALLCAVKNTARLMTAGRVHVTNLTPPGSDATTQVGLVGTAFHHHDVILQHQNTFNR
jgi:hypothetical protein